MRKLLSGLVVASVLLQGCNIINPKEDIPAYVQISSFRSQIDTVQQGTASTKITDVWISTGTTNLGAYQLPVRVPIMEKGNIKLALRPGVMQNGISITRVPYPFYAPYDTTVNLSEAKIDTLRPIVRYASNTKFRWLENFNGSSPTIKLSPNSMATYRLTNNKDTAYEGTSLEATITSDKPFFQIQSSSTFDLPRGQAVWMEINYKTEVPIEVGIFSINSSNVVQKTVAGMNPVDHWNKIYLDLSTAVSEESSERQFAIYIGALKGNSDPGGKLLIDNIKLLSF